MFFLQETPNTTGYLIAGYAVILSVIAIYLVSLYLRNRNMNQDLEMLEELEKEGRSQ